MKSKKLLLGLGGATGSGKTALAVKLVKKHPELVILSADSRQIYKKLDIGTAKIGQPGTDTSLSGQKEPVWIVDDIPQFLTDIAEPNTNFTVADYQTETFRLIEACWLKGKIPLLVGGTGLYINAVAGDFQFTGSVNQVLRRALEPLSLPELYQRLEDVGGTLVPTDRDNKRRVIRAIERAVTQESVQPNSSIEPDKIWLGVLERPWDEQRNLAPAMVDERLALGLVNETKQLLESGVDKDWLKNRGLSYRLVISMLDGEFKESELRQLMIDAFRQLMRRQRTWFKGRKYDFYGSVDKIEEKISSLLTD
jgi:tRNA dimethylallyltransferase